MKLLVSPAPGVTMAVRHLLIGFLSLCMSMKLVWQVTNAQSRRGIQALTEVRKLNGEKAVDNEACYNNSATIHRVKNMQFFAVLCCGTTLDLVMFSCFSAVVSRADIVVGGYDRV